MLSLDSLVVDLMFESGAGFKPETLLEALGGAEAVVDRKIVDPDMQDPRFEMELSPSMPFRRRGERRLMIIDDTVAPMRADPRTDPVVPLDLRPERERLIAVCEALPVRLGRIFALGSWGDAVLVARSARDLRAIALLHWALDPTLDVDGKRRAGRLSQQELETKLLAFDKRLEELDESAILANLGPARMERRGDLIVVDVLEDDGTWDVRSSLALETSLAAIDQFSLIPGAPQGGGAQPAPARDEARPGGGRGRDAAGPARAPEPEPEPEPEPDRPPLTSVEVEGRVYLLFPPERFDRDVAAALGKRDFEAVVTSRDAISGPVRDRIYRDGAEFIAPLEFLSEVFVDGVPLSRPAFDQAARQVGEGVRALEVHCPRFGPVVLVDVAGVGRFISSQRDDPAQVVRAITA